MENKTVLDAKNQLDKAFDAVRKETLETVMPLVEALKTEIEMIKEEKEIGKYYTPYYEKVKEVLSKEQVNLSGEKLVEAAFFGGTFNNISDNERDSLVRSARFRVEVSPFLRNIKNIIRSSVTNKKVKIDIPNEKADIIINDILSKNKFDSRLKGWVEKCFIDSEIFIRLYIKEDGNFLIRDTDPLEITEIVYNEDDVEDILGFKRQYNHPNGGMEIRYYKNGENARETRLNDDYMYESGILMFYFKYGYRPDRRGESQLLPILRWDRIYEDNLLDLAKLYHERAKVVWIKEIRGKNANALDSTTKPLASAVFRVETDNIKWRIEDSKLSGFNDPNYGRNHRLAMAAGVNIPEVYMSSDSSRTAYASLRKADTPFGLLIDDTRAFWSENIKCFIRSMLKELVSVGKLPKTTTIKRVPQHKLVEALSILESFMQSKNEERLNEALNGFEAEEEEVRVKTEDLPISVFFPQHTTDNPLQSAQALEVLRRMGLISQRTAIKRAGEDPELEMALMKYDIVDVISVTKTGASGSNTNRNISQTRSETNATNYDSKLGKQA